MQAIHTNLAPAAIGAYSQAICCGNTIYLSGQISLIPETMQLCSEDAEVQIHQVINNLSAVCKASGGSLASIVKLSVYLTDLAHLSLLNEIMRGYFYEPFPARSVIGVSALPRGALIEIDAIMIK